MTNKGIEGLHLVRFGTAADQKYLCGEFLGTYDQLVVNATIVAHMPNGIALFLLQKADKKPYFIDPQTHAFQHGLDFLYSKSQKTGSSGDQPKIKRSVAKLLKEYGDPVAAAVNKNKQPVFPDNFVDKKLSKEFCKRVLDFQRNAIACEAKQSDSKEYYDFAAQKKGISAPSYEPSLLVAPYFFMQASTFDKWLKVNLNCARFSSELVKNLPLAIQIVISQDILTNKDLRNELIQEYLNLPSPPAYFLVWIDQFSEHEASEENLRAYVELIKGLGERARVVNLYGSFFSVALKQLKAVPQLAGICHGLNYGEDRGVVPVGGGLPWAKFYYPGLHKRLLFREALRAVKAILAKRGTDYHKNVCNCEECRKVVASDPIQDFALYGVTKPISFFRGNQPIATEYPLPETTDHCLRHYLWCKQREYHGRISLDSILDELNEMGYIQKVLGLGTTSHCKTWSRVLGGSRADGR